MLASGFTNAPITQLLLLGIVGSAIVASLTDTKYFLWQYWRLLTWQLAYTNSAEVLFAAMTFYQLRVIERLWGSRKFAVGHPPPPLHLNPWTMIFPRASRKQSFPNGG
jgi:hypothetical protein